MYAVFVFVVLLAASQAAISISASIDNCTHENKTSGQFNDYFNVKQVEKCWIIKVPQDSVLVFKLTMDFESTSHNGIEIIKLGTGEKITLTKGSTVPEKYVYHSDVKIVHFARNTDNNVWWSKFAVEYKITRGLETIEGIKKSLSDTVTWLKNQRTEYWGWKEDTPRAVVALHLAGAMNFTGKDLKEELIAKETDVRASLTLLKSPVTHNELSMIINALLVTCHNPHRFYGNNLVRRLLKEVESSRVFTHPIAYLALCNAGSEWPEKATGELSRVLGHTTNYHFVKDIQAMAVMAVSCMLNRGQNFTENSNLTTLYDEAIQRFKSSQLQDGSFGNAHSTALITQALLASGQESARDWNVSGAIRYLMKSVASDMDFLTAYFTLPVLNGKSLVDIAKVDCSATLRRQDEETVIHDTLGKKISIKYSLYLGDNKDIIHTISLTVPENFSAFEVMERAAYLDAKFKFLEKSILGKKYVYKIAGLSNDAENGKFWMQYMFTRSTLHPSSKGPDELIMKNGEHLVMWYKTMHI